jgi:glyoxylase I family protein
MGQVAFHHMALTCKDPQAIERFYRQHFGFHRARVIVSGTQTAVFLRSAGCYLELFQSTQDPPLAAATGSGPEYPGWRHFAFMVDNVDEKLAEMGADARILLGPLDFDAVIPGWRSVWIADPEGNVVELSQGYRDEEQPPQPADVVG